MIYRSEIYRNVDYLRENETIEGSEKSRLRIFIVSWLAGGKRKGNEDNTNESLKS